MVFKISELVHRLLVKHTVMQTHLEKVQAILVIKLSARNLGEAVSTYATLAVCHSFGVVK